MPMAPEIKYGGGRAYYSPTLDYCQIPNKTAFNSPEEYYSTMFHELAHATGHANRLSRKSILEPSYFGSHEYSKEELVAECCIQVIDSWINDTTFISNLDVLPTDAEAYQKQIKQYQTVKEVRLCTYFMLVEFSV
jgi:antirestriction protein ArdC